MLSKIERGLTGLSFATLDQLAATLNVPVSRLFVSHKEGANFSLVKANEGIGIDRRGSKVGMKYELIGHLISGEKFVEPYLVTISDQAAPGPGFQHTGIQFIHMLTGSMIYRYADEVVDLHPGDTLVFDGSAVHGQERLLTETVTCIMAFFYLRG
jgi:hypothetical protein